MTTITTTPCTRSPLHSPSQIMADATSYSGTLEPHADVTQGKSSNHVSSRHQRPPKGHHSAERQNGRNGPPRRLKHHRKSDVFSMMAYSQKMRRISADRTMMAGSSQKSAGPASDPSFLMPDSSFVASDPSLFASAPSLLPSNSSLFLSAPNHSLGGDDLTDLSQGEDVKGGSPNRAFSISGDSRIKRTDTENAKSEKQHEVSDSSTKQGLVGDSLQASLVGDSLQASTSRKMAADCNLETVYENAETRYTSSVIPQNVSSNIGRQRRLGTVIPPDSSGIKVHTQKTRTESGKSSTRGSKNKDSLSSDICWDPCLSITPFPELHIQTPKHKTNEAVAVTGVPQQKEEEEPQSQDVEPKTPQLQNTRTSKLPKTRENYWSFRKAFPRYNLAASSPHTIITAANKNLQQTSDMTLPPVQLSPRPVKKAEAPRKTHFQSFRYSDVVRRVIKLIDKNDDEDHCHDAVIRRVSEVLPTLDIQDLKRTRTRVRRESVKSRKRSDVRDLPSSVTFRKETAVTCVHGRGCEDWFLCCMARDKSLSLPDIAACQSNDRWSQSSG